MDDHVPTLRAERLPVIARLDTLHPVALLHRRLVLQSPSQLTYLVGRLRVRARNCSSRNCHAPAPTVAVQPPDPPPRTPARPHPPTTRPADPARMGRSARTAPATRRKVLPLPCPPHRDTAAHARALPDQHAAVVRWSTAPPEQRRGDNAVDEGASCGVARARTAPACGGNCAPRASCSTPVTTKRRRCSYAACCPTARRSWERTTRRPSACSTCSAPLATSSAKLPRPRRSPARPPTVPPAPARRPRDPRLRSQPRRGPGHPGRCLRGRRGSRRHLAAPRPKSRSRRRIHPHHRQHPRRDTLRRRPAPRRPHRPAHRPRSEHEPVGRASGAYGHRQQSADRGTQRGRLTGGTPTATTPAGRPLPSADQSGGAIWGRPGPACHPPDSPPLPRPRVAVDDSPVPCERATALFGGSTSRTREGVPSAAAGRSLCGPRHDAGATSQEPSDGGDGGFLGALEQGAPSPAGEIDVDAVFQVFFVVTVE